MFDRICLQDIVSSTMRIVAVLNDTEVTTQYEDKWKIYFYQDYMDQGY